MDRADYTTVDEYIASFPEDIQLRLRQIRDTIRAAVPDAVERISYQMPTFALSRNLVYFAAFTRHIGFYPTASGIQAFADELAAFPLSKGTVRLPLDRELPLDLIRRIAVFRAEEDRQLAAQRTAR